ncbi:MAG: Rieske 2Fe-2S domain-containing protein [Chloroflexota bacterium]|nr:Rieske 2Fe-2S domain-containing protein [Chloroflexota bacterium]
MKTERYVEDLIQSVPFLQEVGKELARAIHQAVLDGGPAARNVADVLHGTWLGHPLHPVLTDLPVGAWTIATLFDSLEGEKAEYAADQLMTIGTIAAVPTAISGLADYSTIPAPAASTGTLHALIMNLTFTFYLGSLWQRRKGNRGRAVFLSSLGFILLMVGAYLGGHLSYKQKVGVDHSKAGSKPKEWTAVMDEEDLNEHEAKRVEVEGEPILLYRYGGTIYAIGAVCSHAGGPLEKGQFDGFCVQCPWHDSVFDVRDGGIVHGPATYPQSNYGARIKDGRIEVRVENVERGGGHGGHSHGGQDDHNGRSAQTSGHDGQGAQTGQAS